MEKLVDAYDDDYLFMRKKKYVFVVIITRYV